MASQDIKAWTFTNGYPDTLTLSTFEIPKPENVEDGTTLVKVHACALNPVDIQHMNLPDWNDPDNQAPKGCVRDFSGTVLAGGGHVGLQKGDQVFGITLDVTKGGALAQEVILGDKALAIKKPNDWSHEQAAAVPLVWLTARTCVEDVSSTIEKTSTKKLVVLGGSSSTGIYTVILAKKRGWTVLATSSAKNRDFILGELKADQHVDYTAQDVRDEVTKFSPDAIIDCVGGTECIGILGNQRYITIVGDKTGRTTMGGPYTYYDWKSPVNAASQWMRWAKGEAGLGETYDVAILSMKKEWLEESTTEITPKEIFIDSTYAFEDAKQAFERLNTGRAKGKVVVKIV